MAFISLLLSGSPTFAQQTGTNSPPEQDLQSAEDRAFALFEASQEHYNAGAFDEAASLLEQAYGLHPEPVLLYNLGRAREGQNDAAGAINAYRTFLDQSPDTEDRGAIEARIASLQLAIEERAQLEAERQRLESEREDAEERARTSSSRTGQRAASWTLAATGAVSIGAGVLLGVLSNQAEDRAVGATAHLEATQQRDRAENLSLGANIAFAAGGAFLLAGVTWLLIGSLRDDNSDSDGPEVDVAIGAGHLAVRGAF